MDIYLLIEIIVVPLLAGALLDKCLGDPVWLPHPVVGFGRLISFFEHRLNRGKHRRLKGAVMSVLLVIGTFLLVLGIVVAAYRISVWLYMLLASVGVFYCLAGKTLIDEVREVFQAVDLSVEAGRKQVARIVGRDTARLTGQEVRTAALETLAENLSDGVIAPLCWYLIGGIPGMMAYKMINTLDSMIGYRNERYRLFGTWAARMDDVANYLPARLTSLLMVLASGHPGLWRFVRKYGKEHASPNSGYPEAALAGILNCRFGGPHNYFGELVYKPFIGVNSRELTTYDMRRAIRINRMAETEMLVLMLFLYVILVRYMG